MNRALLITAALPLIVGVAACGDDDQTGDAAPGRTTAAYCADLQALEDGGGGPTDAFFEKYPDPTLADWAAGLPDVISTAKDQRDTFAKVAPSADLVDERRALVQAFDKVVASFEASLVAAKAGDQKAFDAEEARNQDDNVPALMDAFQALTAACGGGK